MRAFFRVLEVVAITALVCGFIYVAYDQISNGLL